MMKHLTTVMALFLRGYILISITLQNTLKTVFLCFLRYKCHFLSADYTVMSEYLHFESLKSPEMLQTFSTNFSSHLRQRLMFCPLLMRFCECCPLIVELHGIRNRQFILFLKLSISSQILTHTCASCQLDTSLIACLAFCMVRVESKPQVVQSSFQLSFAIVLPVVQVLHQGEDLLLLYPPMIICTDSSTTVCIIRILVQICDLCGFIFPFLFLNYLFLIFS